MTSNLKIMLKGLSSVKCKSFVEAEQLMVTLDKLGILGQAGERLLPLNGWDESMVYWIDSQGKLYSAHNSERGCILYSELFSSDPVVVLEVFGSLCETETFTINDVNANSCDFGESMDISQYQKERGCSDHQFAPRLPSNAILDKYTLDADGYAMICSLLVDKLSFGCCNRCV